jgi:hypothetical protein
VKLKITIEGQGIIIQSQSWYYAGPFTVEPGVPLMLSSSDLAGLLDENNLSFTGISRQQYDQRKVLPEGLYTITVTAYDFQNPLNVRVSNDAVAQAWMLLNDAPMPNFPQCGAVVQPVDPQQLTFSWTTFNAGYTSAQGAEYTFELWEIFPANSNPGNIIASTAPIFSLTTSMTLISYGIAEPPLTVGREYVWRVRAQDIESRELFRNNGYSAVCTFSWGSVNALLGNLAALQLSVQAVTHRQARCTWDSLSVFENYKIEFRKAGGGSWFPFTTDRASIRITDLEPGTSYEAHVQGIFSDGNTGPWSNLATWQTPLQQQLACGESSPPPAQQNFHPLTQAATGMIWQVGQFEMLVMTITAPVNTGGWYSGTGKIVLPFGATVACEFSGIRVGDDHVMYSGEVRAATNGISSWLTQFTMSQFNYDTSYFYSGNIDSLYVNANGDLVIIDENGNSTIVDIETAGGVLITDSNGDQWIVNPDGSVTFVTGGFLLPLTNDTLNAQEMRILKLAMTSIRNEISAGTIQSKQNEMASRKTALQSHVQAQQQSFPAPPANATIIADSAEFVSYAELPGASADAGYSLGNAYKTAEQDYYSASVLQVMSRADCPDAELNFIGQYLSVNGTPYCQFVAQQLAQSQSEQQIANTVAADGIKKLVELTLKKQMSR